MQVRILVAENVFTLTCVTTDVAVKAICQLFFWFFKGAQMIQMTMKTFLQIQEPKALVVTQFSPCDISIFIYYLVLGPDHKVNFAILLTLTYL